MRNINTGIYLINAGYNSERLLNMVDDTFYTTPITQLQVDSIGAHFRHVLDHFDALFRGMGEGTIDYGIRSRGSIVQTSRCAGVKALKGASEKLTQIDPKSSLLVMVGCGGQSTLMRSSFQRELDWVAQHTVHHYAIIALSCRWRDVIVPPTFGLAPATLRFRNSRGGADIRPVLLSSEYPEPDNLRKSHLNRIPNNDSAKTCSTYLHSGDWFHTQWLRL